MWLYAKIIEVKNYTDTKYLIIFGKRLDWDPLGYTVIFQKINEFKIQVGYGQFEVIRRQGFPLN